MTMIDTPMFFAAVPRTFLDKMLALKPDPATGKPNPDALAKFAATHPDARGQARFLAEHNPPVSYANDAYYGIHTFKFVGKDDAVTLVKWRFVPQDGMKPLGDAQLKSMPRDFLEQALIERTQAGPVRWDMVVTLGKPGDAEDDPTVLWPTDRKEVKAGTLTLTSAMPSQGGGCAEINYDPLVMGDGIAPTRDPTLLFRSPSYGVSAGRRLQGQ
jgi:catalase